MNATPPEAKEKYSRAAGPPEGVSALTPAVPVAVFGACLVAALLLIIAELSTLYQVRTQASPGPIKSIETGSHHAYALIPIGALAAVLAYGAWHERSRPALVAIGALGVIALLIAVIGDLPDAQATGLISRGGHYLNASSTPKAGLYLETLGAAILILTAGLGLMLQGSAPRAQQTQRGRRGRWAPPRSAR
jgi:hypothetical protein